MGAQQNESKSIKVKLPEQTIDFIKSKANLLEEKTCGIYFLKHNGVVVYVGQSTNIKRRIKNHLSAKEKVFSDFEFITCGMELLNETETAYIYRFDPVFNKKDSLTEGVSIYEYCAEHNIDFTEGEAGYSRNPTKITDIEMCKFYDVPIRTMVDWKVTREKRYAAMKLALIYEKHSRKLIEMNREFYKLEKENQ